MLLRRCCHGDVTTDVGIWSRWRHHLLFTRRCQMFMVAARLFVVIHVAGDVIVTDCRRGSDVIVDTDGALFWTVTEPLRFKIQFWKNTEQNFINDTDQYKNIMWLKRNINSTKIDECRSTFQFRSRWRMKREVRRVGDRISHWTGHGHCQCHCLLMSAELIT